MLNDILPHLKGVTKRNNQWWAICPAHPDKNPSLHMKEEDDRVLMHCFGCQANGIQVLDALGLSHSLLFRDIKRGGIPKKVLEQAEEDMYFIAVYEASKERGERIRYNDWRRYQKAQQRVKLLKAS